MDSKTQVRARNIEIHQSNITISMTSEERQGIDNEKQVISSNQITGDFTKREIRVDNETDPTLTVEKRKDGFYISRKVDLAWIILISCSVLILITATFIALWKVGLHQQICNQKR